MKNKNVKVYIKMGKTFIKFSDTEIKSVLVKETKTEDFHACFFQN